MIGGDAYMTGILITAYSFVAAVIGAGFASGQEVLSFFSLYGKWGLLGIGVSSFVFGGFSYFVLSACVTEKTSDYNTLLGRFMNRGARRISAAVTLVFLVCSFAVMTACFGETAYLLFGLNKAASSAAFAAVCTVTAMTGSDRALKLNGVLGAVIAFGITAAALYMLRYREHQTFMTQASAVVSGGGYAGYNLIGAGVILAGLSRNIKTKSEAAVSAALAAGALSFMLLLIFALIGIYRKYIDLGELPMLTLALREGRGITYFYSVMLMLAVVTTAVSDVVGAAELTAGRLPRYVSAAAVGIIGFAVSGAGFSAVINTAYRACGFLGMGLILYTIIKYKKYKKERKREKNRENKR